MRMNFLLPTLEELTTTILTSDTIGNFELEEGRKTISSSISTSREKKLVRLEQD